MEVLCIVKRKPGLAGERRKPVLLTPTDGLNETFIRVLDEFRNRYLLSYSPEGMPREGWHRLDVRVKGRRLAVKSRPGYWGR